MGAYHIQEIEGKTATLDQLKQFSIVPFFIPWYKSQESNKVLPLYLNEIMDLNASERPLAKIIGNNPFFEHTDITYLIAKKDDTPVGRIAAFVDRRYNDENDESSGWIGLPEFTEDLYVGEHLIQSAIESLKKKGCKKVIGPAKFNANGEIGLLVEGFDKKPFFMEGYNAPYYQEYFENLGFKKENDWYSIQADVGEGSKLRNYMSKAESLIQHAKNSSSERTRLLRDVNIRPISFADFKKEVGVLEELYNGEWGGGNHPQFVTMTHNEMDALASGIKTIALEELVLVAELDGKPIGISATVPNLNEVITSYDNQRPGQVPSQRFLSVPDLKRDISILADTKARLSAAKSRMYEPERNSLKQAFDSYRVLILGVKKEYRQNGIEGLLTYNTFKNARKMGGKYGSFSLLADINSDIINMLLNTGDIAMTYRVYSLDI